jgi:hypothetical protein
MSITGMPASSTTTCDAATPLRHVQDVEAVRADLRCLFPESLAQFHVHHVFGEPHGARAGERAGCMRHHRVEIAGDEAAEALPIAAVGGAGGAAHVSGGGHDESDRDSVEGAAGGCHGQIMDPVPARCAQKMLKTSRAQRRPDWVIVTTYDYN